MNTQRTHWLFFRNSWIVWLTLLALILRLFQLAEWSFWHDEALTVLLAQKPLGELIAITAADVHPPLYYLVVKLFTVAGQNEWLARFPSALSGAGAVFVLTLLGRELFDDEVGLAAGFIMAISPLQLFYAQEARMYTLLLLLTIFSAWCLFRALREDRLFWWVLYSGGTTLACYTAYFAFPVLAAMGLYVLLVDRRRGRVFHFLLSMGVVILLYFPWIGILTSQTRAVFDTYWIETPHPLLLFTTLSAFFTGYTLPVWGIVVALAATLLIIFVVLNNVRHAFNNDVPVQPLLWLLLWGFVPLLGTFIISLLLIPMFQLRTVITAAPAFYLLVGWGLARTPHRKLNILIFGPLLAMMLISVLNFYFNPTFAKPGWREAARFVFEHTQPGDVILHTSPGSYLPFLSYERSEHSAEHILLPDPKVMRENAASQPIIAAIGGRSQTLESAVRGHERAWLVVGLDQSVAYQLAQKRNFDGRYRLLEENEISGIQIFAYALQ